MATHAIPKARTSARRAANSRWTERLGRVGYAAVGVSYGVVAILALKLALGEGGKTTDRAGALETLAQDAFGKALLVLLAVGFAAYAVFQLACALLDRRDEGDDAKGLAKRAGFLGRAAIYLALLGTTIALLAGGGGNGGEEKQATGGVLGWPGGQELVGAIAVAVAAAGLWNGYRALSRSFEDKLRTGEMSEAWRKLALASGMAGLAARAVVFVLIGVFLMRAAVQFDPKEAVGLDGALAKLAHASYGSYLLGLTAAGLLAYAVFCLVQARWREL